MARLIKKILYSIIGLVLVLAGLEWVGRRRSAPDPRQWTTRPLPAVASRATRIVVLGDSIAYAADLQAEQAWPALLEKRLYETAPDQRWQVINAGVNGNTSADAYARFDQHVRAFQPHVVLIALGLNDCRQVVRDADQRRVAAFYEKETSIFGRFYLYRGLRKRFFPWTGSNAAYRQIADSPRVPPETFSALLHWMTDACRRLHAQPVLISLTPLGEQLDLVRHQEFARWSQYNTLVAQVARSLHVPFIDVSQPFLKAQHWSADGVHLSPSGEAELAHRIWTGMQQSLFPSP